MKMKNVIIFLMFSLLVVIVACDEDDNTKTYEEQLAIDIGKIQDYLLDSNLTALSTESGLHYIIEVEGTGSYPTVDSIVEVVYRGRYISGVKFNSLDTIEVELNDVILGWREGIPLYKEGGKGMLFIPSCLGYGVYDNYNNGIPGNSVLVFDIELISVTD